MEGHVQLNITASNGVGFISDSELSEALGACLLHNWGGYDLAVRGKMSSSGNGDREWWDYRGHRYAVILEHMGQGPTATVRLHFDYYGETPR